VITRVPGIRVGHWTDRVGCTGCTVVLCPPGTVGSGEVRGGAPGTRETDLLRPGTLVQEVHAVLLTGGSAFGLAAADGVMTWLEARGIGFDTEVARVPIVPAAVLFDLSVGDAAARPGAEAGAAACDAAAGDSADVEEGSVGAGTGATVAKLRGMDGAWKGGVGSASRQEGDLIVGALAAVNALGEILDDDGAVLAGSRTPSEEAVPPPDGTHTTLVVVATNAALTKERAHLLSLAGHDGLSTAVRPSHTMRDGDTVFALATGAVEARQVEVEALASRAVAEAIRRAVLLATSVPDFPAVSEMGKGRPS
jgi:L-aminopeptidase/D-esterase-like protein